MTDLITGGGIHLPTEMNRNRDYARRREMTLADLLLENRIIFLGGEISEGAAMNVAMQMLYLQHENKTQELSLYIYSPGGSLTAMHAIYDTMQYMECPIATYCMGMAASAAAVLLAAGTKGKRFALPNSKMMCHQPSGGSNYAQVSDLEIVAKEMAKDHAQVNQLLAKLTGQPIDVIARETDRDRWFNAFEAKEFGLIDDVLIPPEKK